MSKTRLRVLRRDIRRELGVSSDPVPTVEQLLEALALLGAALDNASGGAYGAAVYDFSTATHLPARSVIEYRARIAAAWHKASQGEITFAEYNRQEAELSAWLHGRAAETVRHDI